MNKIKIKPSAYIMLAAMLISDRIELLFLYFLSAAIHEFGHLIAAKVSGVGVDEIRFTYSGMRICMEKKMLSYMQELVTAISGPLANLLVIVASYATLALMNVNLNEAILSCNDLLFNNLFTFSGAIAFLSLSSFLQGCINLLPVRTFDGGRVIHCTAALIFGEKAADRVLDVLSACSAFLIWTFALYLMLKISSGLGIYVFSACLFFGSLEKNADCANVSFKKIK